jgi:hypothetical protein
VKHLFQDAMQGLSEGRYAKRPCIAPFEEPCETSFEEPCETPFEESACLFFLKNEPKSYIFALNSNEKFKKR